MLLVLLLGCSAGHAPAVALAAPVATTSSTSPEPNADALARDIDTLLANETGVYGIVVMTAAGQTLYSRNSGVPFVAASLYKLLVMATVYELEALGTMALDEPMANGLTVADALFAMIAYSDNDAAHALLERVGGSSVVNRTAQQLGLDHTQIAIHPTTLADWPPETAADSTQRATQQGTDFVVSAASAGATDVTTPEDMARFFRLLLAGQIVSADASDAMLALLAQQTINDRLPVLLPRETDVAHKTGNLPGVIHDAGIVTTPAGPMIVAALTEAMPDEARTIATIQRVALAVYESSVWLPRWETMPNR